MVVLPASAAVAASVVIRPDTEAIKQTYAELSAAWWQYTLSFPPATSPFFDVTGANCASGQSSASPVFFLVGSLSNEPVERDQCVVPAGKMLFFPMINTVDVNTTNQSAVDLRLEIKPIEDGAHNLFARIDATNVPDPKDFRTLSTVFSLALPDGNLLGLAAGTYQPAVADGYYVLVAPLPVGQHRVAFGGVDANGFSQKIIYHLTVR